MYALKAGEYLEVDEIIEPIVIVVTIDELKAQIETTDYKIIKCYEYQLIGKILPYDIFELHLERQALREQINALEQQQP